MTELDYHNFLLNMNNLGNSLFEFWLGSTFAFILALHFASTNLSAGLYRLLLALYAFTSMVFIIRYTNTMLSSAAINERMVEAGIRPFPLGFDWGGPFTYMSTLAIMVCGTFAAVFFAYREKRKGT